MPAGGQLKTTEVLFRRPVIFFTATDPQLRRHETNDPQTVQPTVFVGGIAPRNDTQAPRLLKLRIFTARNLPSRSSASAASTMLSRASSSLMCASLRVCDYFTGRPTRRAAHSIKMISG